METESRKELTVPRGVPGPLMSSPEANLFPWSYDELRRVASQLMTPERTDRPTLRRKVKTGRGLLLRVQ
jgi:hypothetical protein